jgi:hypothetical protein
MQTGIGTTILTKFLILSLSFVFSCNADITKKCFKAKMITPHCEKNSVLIEFAKPNDFSTRQEVSDGGTRYYGVLVDFPMSSYKRDSTIYVKFHYDKDREEKVGNRACPQNLSFARVFVFDGMGMEFCN